MTTPMYEVTVECENCFTTYSGFRRDSINLMLSPDLDESDIDEQLSTTCPNCGHKDFGVGMLIGTND